MSHLSMGGVSGVGSFQQSDATFKKKQNKSKQKHCDSGHHVLCVDFAHNTRMAMFAISDTLYKRN